MKKNSHTKNTGNESIRSGDFGESFIAYLLAKEGIEVVRANTVGFDLLAIDQTGKLFPKKKLIGISVKARISKTHKRYRPTIPMGSAKIWMSMKKWDADAYIGIVVGSQDGDFDAFVFPHKDLLKLGGRTRRKDVVAVSELYKNSNKNIIKLF